MNKIEKGKRGERIAEEIYKKWGHKILHRNARTPFGEIDIITQCQGITHLIEVKVVGKSTFGSVYEKWKGRQRARFIRAIKYFVAKGIIEIENITCELISIDITNPGTVRFKRFQNLPVDI